MNDRDKALENDMLIQDLALYEITKGGMKTATKEDIIKLQDRFAEYKSLIMRGEFTYDELSARIYSKWGIVDTLVQPVPMPPLPPPPQEETDAFLDTIKEMLKSEQKPYRWYQKIWDRIRLLCSRFSVNI